MKRNERGIARSDMIHIAMWMLSGVSEMKSQKLSCAVCACGNPRSGSCFRRMNQVGKLDRILNEKHRDVVSDDVPVALLGVELDRETAHIAREIGDPLLPATVEKRTNSGRLLACPLEQIGAREVGQRFVVLEIAMRAEAARMHYPLGNAFMIEMKNLLAKMEIFQRGRPARADFQRVLIVGNRYSLLRGQRWNIAIRGLMNLTAGA